MTVDTAIKLQLAGYILFMLTPFVSLYIKGVSRKHHSVLLKYLASIFAMYALVSVPLANLNYQLDVVVQSLDRDGNGFFSPEEEEAWTAEEARAYGIYLGDGGRNVFGYLVSPIFASAYTAAIFLMFYGSCWLVGKIKNRAGA